MKQIAQALLLTGLSVSAATAYASTGYVDDSIGTSVRTGYGDCVHTARWSIPNAIVECDPEIVAARDKTNLASVEVVMATRKNPVRLEAQTLFDFDSAKLTRQGKTLLDDMLANLTAASLIEQKLQIRGYADRIGSDAYNMKLSKRRAAAVRDYLVSNGVVPAFIEMRGLGETAPVVNCAGQHGASLIKCLAPNRRAEVEFSAVEVKQVEEKVSARQ